MEGWFKLYRKVVEWEWFEDPHMVQLFIYLLVKASREDKKWHGIELKRGQVVSSVASILTALNPKRTKRDTALLTTKMLRNRLKRLEDSGTITTESCSKYTLITICNFDNYQQDEGQAEGKPRANEGQAEGKQRANEGQHLENIKKERIERKSSSLRSELSKASPAAHTREGGAGTDENSQGVASTGAEPSESTEATEATPTTEQPKTPKPEAVMELFNSAVRDKRIPKIAKMTERRTSAIHARVSEYGSEAIATVIAKAAASVFLNGGGAKQFVATFDWIFLPNNFPKILEGNFDNPPTPTTTASPTTTPTQTTTAHGTPQGITSHRTAEAGRAERENEWLSHAMARLHEGTDHEATANPFELADG